MPTTEQEQNLHASYVIGKKYLDAKTWPGKVGVRFFTKPIPNTPRTVTDTVSDLSLYLNKVHGFK